MRPPEPLTSSSETPSINTESSKTLALRRNYNRARGNIGTDILRYRKNIIIWELGIGFACQKIASFKSKANIPQHNPRPWTSLPVNAQLTISIHGPVPLKQRWISYSMIMTGIFSSLFIFSTHSSIQIAKSTLITILRILTISASRRLAGRNHGCLFRTIRSLPIRVYYRLLI